jgi:hypothetical protein
MKKRVRDDDEEVSSYRITLMESEALYRIVGSFAKKN